MGHGGDPDEFRAYASPPCFSQEFDAGSPDAVEACKPHDRLLGVDQKAKTDHERAAGNRDDTPAAEQRSRLLPHRAFPPYAYLSGRFPHPVRDPAGHSYNGGFAVPLNEAPLDPEAFRWGVDLFNHGFYWEAHEAWEPLWRAAEQRGPRRDILKGLILLAAAGVKLRQRKLGPAGRHGRRAVTHFRHAAQALDGRLEPTLGLSPTVLAAQGELAAAAAPHGDSAPLDPEILFPFTLGSPDPAPRA